MGGVLFNFALMQNNWPNERFSINPRLEVGLDNYKSHQTTNSNRTNFNYISFFGKVVQIQKLIFGM